MLCFFSLFYFSSLFSVQLHPQPSRPAASGLWGGSRPPEGGMMECAMTDGLPSADPSVQNLPSLTRRCLILLSWGLPPPGPLAGCPGSGLLDRGIHTAYQASFTHTHCSTESDTCPAFCHIYVYRMCIMMIYMYDMYSMYINMDSVYIPILH